MMPSRSAEGSLPPPAPRAEAWRRWSPVARLILLVAFLSTGGMALAEPLSARLPPVRGPFATSDAWLGVLAIADPSRAVQGAVAAVPGDQQLVFVGPSQDGSVILTYYTVSHLVWPRKVWLQTCAERGRPPLSMFAPPAAVQSAVGFTYLFYVLEPPAGATVARTIGPRMWVVESPERTWWTQPCSA
jgi:hypothetical protein